MSNDPSVKVEPTLDVSKVLAPACGAAAAH
jgi:hypothetical protein